MTHDEFTSMMHFIAQGAVNVAEGHTTIERDSRIYKAWNQLCTAVSEGRVALVKHADDGTHPALIHLTTARNALDEASRTIYGRKGNTLAKLYTKLGTITRDVEAIRDEIDIALNMPEGDTLTVQISVHAYSFLQLDSREHVEGYGLRESQIQDTRRGGAKITGTPEQLQKLAGFLDPAIVDGTDVERRAKGLIKLDRQRLLDAVIVAASSTAPNAQNTKLTDAQRIDHTHDVMTRPDMGRAEKRGR